MPSAPNTAGNYAFLNSIKDPDTRRAMKVLLDRVGNVEQLTQGIGTVSAPLADHLDADGNKVQNLADPTLDKDAVNLTSMRKYVAGAIALSKIPPKAPPGPGSGGGPTPPPPNPPPVDFVDAQDGTGNVRIGKAGAMHLSATGALFPYRGISAFLLYKRFLDGEDISPIVASYIAAGANVFRVWGMCYNVTNFYPKNYPNYYTQLPVFAGVLNAAGGYLNYTALVDAQLVFQGTTASASQIQHANDSASALAGLPNIFYELTNEWPKQSMTMTSFQRPSGLLASIGTALEDQLPWVPPWDFVSVVSSRNDEWPRKSKDLLDNRDGYTGFQGFKRACIDMEPMGAGDVDIAGKRSTNPDDFYWYAVTAAMMGAGAVFHSDQGIQTQVLAGTQLACANAFFSGMQAADVNSQFWGFTRGPFADCPIQHVDLPDPAGALRTYAKLTDHNAIVVAIRPGAAWVPIPQAGWAISSRVGPGGSVLYMTK